MSGIILLIAIILAGASFTAYTAKSTIAASDGPNWATNACSSIPHFCQYPHQMVYAAAGLAGLWVLLRFISAIRD
jgi:hypothetical protein